MAEPGTRTQSSSRLQSASQGVTAVEPLDVLISDVDVSDTSWLEDNGLTYPLNQLSFVWMGKSLFCVMKAVEEVKARKGVISEAS